MADLPYVIVPSEPTHELLIAMSRAQRIGRSSSFPDGIITNEGFREAIAASGCPVSLDEIVGVLTSAREDLLYFAHARGSEYEGTDAEVTGEIDALLHRLKAQTPGEDGS